VAVNELDEAAALAGGNLDVSDLAESLEEAAKLILGNVAAEASDEDSGVVRVSELVHLLLEGSAAAVALVEVGTRRHAVEALLLLLLLLGVHGGLHVLGVVAAGARAAVGTSMVAAVVGQSRPASQSGAVGLSLPVLRGGSGDSHGTVAAVDSLHLYESALLILLVRETHEAVAARLAGDRVGHDLSRLAAGETSLEE
jgi:hypothetical protein